jgi:hypothetical protein
MVKVVVEMFNEGNGEFLENLHQNHESRSVKKSPTAEVPVGFTMQ